MIDSIEYTIRLDRCLSGAVVVFLSNSMDTCDSYGRFSLSDIEGLFNQSAGVFCRHFESSGIPALWLEAHKDSVTKAAHG